MKTKGITTKRAAGKKAVAKEKSKDLFSLYDNCDICPLWVYIDIVCDNKLESLIIKGKPTNEELEEGKVRLLIDYSNASGNLEQSSKTDKIRKIYHYTASIQGLFLCINLIELGEYESTFDYLKTHNIYEKDPSKIIEKIISKIRSYELQINKNKNDLSTSPSEKIKREDFEKELVVLSKYMGFQITKFNTRLSEYIQYRKSYEQYILILNSQKNGIQH